MVSCGHRSGGDGDEDGNGDGKDHLPARHARKDTAGHVQGGQDGKHKSVAARSEDHMSRQVWKRHPESSMAGVKASESRVR